MDVSVASLCVPKRHSRRSSTNRVSPLIATFEAAGIGLKSPRTVGRKSLKALLSRRGSLLSPHPCTPVRAAQLKKSRSAPLVFASSVSPGSMSIEPADDQWEDVDELLNDTPPAIRKTPEPDSGRRKRALDKCLISVQDHSERIASAIKTTLEQQPPMQQSTFLQQELDKHAEQLRAAHEAELDALQTQLNQSLDTNSKLEDTCHQLRMERDQLLRHAELKTHNVNHVKVEMQQSLEEYEQDVQELTEQWQRKESELEATIKSLRRQLADAQDACEQIEERQQQSETVVAKQIQSALEAATGQQDYEIKVLEDKNELLDCQLTDARVQIDQLQLHCQQLEADNLSWQQRCDELIEQHQLGLQEQECYYLQRMSELQTECDAKIRELSEAELECNRSQRPLSLSDWSDDLDNSLHLQLQAQEAITEAAQLKRDMAAVGELIRQSSKLKSNKNLPELMRALGMSDKGQVNLGTHLQAILKKKQDWKDKAQKVAKENNYYARRIVKLEKAMESIERHYMSSIVLNVKLNAIASDSAHKFRCTESVNTMFTEAKLQDIGFEQWPLWIADRLIGHARA
eukprot:TRINITY_DN12438_c2_g4_i1.p1 TRINITY_DN12438_c2_g4~~TRINITY_DN12438_c2_g4_i1.p1  ORF type:complete len:573 (+),score=133.84 TRINITY_DN12438_c2_g4_i1:201-1919(+)